MLVLQTQKRGALAQSVEQRTENPCVAGSIPAGTTSKSLSEMRGFLVLSLFQYSSRLTLIIYSLCAIALILSAK